MFGEGPRNLWSLPVGLCSFRVPRNHPRRGAGGGRGLVTMPTPTQNVTLILLFLGQHCNCPPCAPTLLSSQLRPGHPAANCCDWNKPYQGPPLPTSARQPLSPKDASPTQMERWEARRDLSHAVTQLGCCTVFKAQGPSSYATASPNVETKPKRKTRHL